MEEMFKWCPKCGTMVPTDKKPSPMAVVGLLVMLGAVIDVPIVLAFVPLTPVNMMVFGGVLVTNVIIGAFFIRKGGMRRCHICNTPTPLDHPPAGPTDFARPRSE